MKSIIPYEKEINFETKISEISSISLEYEADLVNDAIEGNFLLEGEYKVHEVSVNKEPFKFKLPFVVELGNNLDPKTVKHDISDFTYDIVGDTTLKVNIDLLVEGEELEVKPEEEDRKGELIDDDDDEEVMADYKMSNTTIEDLIDNLDLPIKDAPMVIDEESLDKIKEEVKEEKETKEEMVDKSIILNNALNSEDSYVTYHIHIVKEEETLESIATMEHVSKEVISDCNDTNNLVPGIKLIIPSSSDE